MRNKMGIYLLISLLVIIIDAATKWWIKSEMNYGESIQVIGDFFRITSHRNLGAAFGILQNQRLFFIIITIVIVIGIVWFLRKSVQEQNKFLSFALSLLLGGAIGNFIDRATTGEVVDFFDFYFAFIDYHFPIFNIADCAIVIGVCMLILDNLLLWRKEKKESVMKHEQS
ncbi:signal peptidase II [Marinicrinis sediminis]|uniref:Lipoprotein signal peptidase n=1 Tax=Marinicrinis sediminis TaxID=1652465 RepID=A0ABW5RB62_9BACL